MVQAEIDFFTQFALSLAVVGRSGEDAEMTGLIWLQRDFIKSGWSFVNIHMTI